MPSRPFHQIDDLISTCRQRTDQGQIKAGPISLIQEHVFASRIAVGYHRGWMRGGVINR